MADAPRAISVVLDENVDEFLRHHFGPGVRAETVRYRGWKELQNGKLLQAIGEAGDVDVFVTADQNLPHQQHIRALPFAVLVLRPRRKTPETLIALMPEVRRLLPSVRPGTVTEVFTPPEARAF